VSGDFAEAGEPGGQHYVDTGIGEDGAPAISHYGIKLSPNEHAAFYDDVRGHSEARPWPEEPKVARPLVSSVMRCCEHPRDDDRNELGTFGIHS
jgi:hypothetical protein